MPIETFDNFDKIFLGHTPTICWEHGKEYLPHNHKLGNNPIYEPIIKNNVYLLDTGCGKGGYLTIYDINNDILIQTSKKY